MTINANLQVSDFDFDLPEELIAQQPPAERGTSRMLVLDRATGQTIDSQFTDLPSLLNPGDLLILNDSRVLPARLYARRTTSRGKQQSTGQIEVLLTNPETSLEASGENSLETSTPASPDLRPNTSPGNSIPTVVKSSIQQWKALVKPGRKIHVGDQLEFFDENDQHVTEGAGAFRPQNQPQTQVAFSPGNRPPILRAQVIARGEFGERTLRFDPVPDFYAALDQIGHMPLPPYIKRQDAIADQARYQTVFAEQQGSVAAPTAGLHFTPEILTAIESRGVEIQKLTLHVGLGTFAPLRVENVADIRLHSERYTLPAATAQAINRARIENRRIVAVGTTTVRTLEHLAQQSQGHHLEPHSGETSIFLSPGHQFQLVDAILTNFHLPKSSLLMLVSALAGRNLILSAYHHAVQQQYRFFSYGDCMFLQ